jgi:hypothetical protein
VRSFGADPAMVARLTAAQVAGYQAAGVAATAKHFPGHGDTTVDSHAGLPVIGHSRAPGGSPSAAPPRGRCRPAPNRMPARSPAPSPPRASDVMVVLTRNAWTSAGASQRRLVSALAATGRPVVAVGGARPLRRRLPRRRGGQPGHHGDRPAPLEALANVLGGELRPAGKLPVAIPAAGPGTQAFPIGAGMSGL